MGVSFTWEPVNPKKQNSFAAGSTLYKHLENAFGSFPLLLDRSHIEKLEGICCCDNHDLKCLIDAIDEHGSVRVEAHW